MYGTAAEDLASVMEVLQGQESANAGYKEQGELANSSRLGDGRLQRLLDWMQINGAQLRGCYVKACTEDPQRGYGLYASSDSTEGILLVTPLRLAITPVTVLQDPVLGAEYGKLYENGQVDDRFLIMLFLLVEHARGNTSFWEPYLDTLPTRFGCTVFFSEEELMELEGTPLLPATERQLKILRMVFDAKVKPLVEKFLSFVSISYRTIEFQDFLWASCVFWSRALSIPCPRSYVFPARPEDGVGSEKVLQAKLTATKQALKNGDWNGDLASQNHIANGAAGGCVPPEFEAGHANAVKLEAEVVYVEGLVPGIDFCNHETRPAALWEVDGEEGAATGIPCSMYLVTLPGYPYSADSEIRIKYGSKGNEELLFLYGFVLEENPDEFIMVHYPKESLMQSACYEAKCQLLQEQNLELRWLLNVSWLKKGFLSQVDNGACSSGSESMTQARQPTSGYSWSGNRKAPRQLDRIVFPEHVLAALRTVAMSEQQLHATMGLLEQLTDSGRIRQPSKEDISAAVWEVCGDAGAYRLLIDLLTAIKFGLEDASGTHQMDAELLERDLDARSQLERALHKSDIEDTTDGLMSDNKRACVVYRMGQKQLAELFLAAAEEALEACED